MAGTIRFRGLQQKKNAKMSMHRKKLRSHVIFENLIKIQDSNIGDIGGHDTYRKNTPIKQVLQEHKLTQSITQTYIFLVKLVIFQQKKTQKNLMME